MLNQPLWLRDLAAYSFQAAVIILAGSLLPPLLRLRLPKVRLIYWQALLGVCLVLPLIQPWQPDSLSQDEAGLTGHISLTLGPAMTMPAVWSLAEVIFLVLLAGVLLRALWVTLGMWKLGLYRRRARRVEMMEPVCEAQRRVAMRPTFYLSHDLASPATFGLRKPAVLLPKRFFALPPPMQTAIACHELLHIARRDWAWNMAEEFILTLLWFHPAVWWVVRNIRLSREQVVDAKVVCLTQSRQAYLRALLEMAQHESTSRSVPAPLFLRESQLAQRVALILKEVSMSRFRLIATCAAAAAALMLTGAVAVWAFPLWLPAQTPASAVESGVPGGIEGGVTGGVAGGTKGGVMTGVDDGANASPGSATTHQVDVKKLKRIHAVMPHYPPEAKKAGIQGKVVLEVTISGKGEVTEVQLISGPPELVKPSVNAVKQWRYAPSPLLPARTKIIINYTLKDDPAPQAAPVPKAEAAPSPNPTPSPKVYKVGKNVSQPIPVVDPDPPYTHQASKAKLQGTVVMAAIISSKGKVISVKEVSKPLGMGLDQNAINTLRTWKFQPALRDGKPVTVKILVEVTFRLFGNKKPGAAAHAA